MIWIIVIFAIIINSLLAWRSFVDSPQLISFYELVLSPFSNIRYGYYLAHKFFLPTIAFLILGYWLFKNSKNLSLSKFKELYFIPIFLIGIPLMIARFFSFGKWFFHDDFRLINHYYSSYPPDFQSTPYAFYPTAMVHLLVRWFEGNYNLYNGLGVFFYFLNGLLIYIIANKLQTKKYISLLAAIFFVTTPTFFQESFLIENLIGDGFLMILFLLSVYLILNNFLAGAIIFVAAALEFGVARSQFIALPLILFGLFFIPKLLKQKNKLLLVLFSFSTLSLIYLPVLLIHHVLRPNNNLLNITNLINKFYILGDMLMGITIPFGINYPLVYFLSSRLNNWNYITVVIGYLTLLSLLFLSLICFFRKKLLASKLFLIAFIIILIPSIPATLMGVRVEFNANKLLEAQLLADMPRTSTAYGFFQAVGLALVVVGLGTLIKAKIFKIIMIGLIIINIATYVYSDKKWNEQWGTHQRKIASQLEKILPRQATPIYIYIPSKQRFLWQGIRDFQEIFRGEQPITAFMDPKDLNKEIQKSHPSSQQLYLLVEDRSYNIYDYSQTLRTLTPKQLNSSEKLINILIRTDKELLDKYYPK